MLGTVRNVDGTNQPFTIAGLSDGSTDIVHRECNEEYQIPMSVDCQYGAGYLGITDCCKFLFNPTTGVAKVNCIETTVTCVDINNNSNIGSNQPILAQGFDEDNLYDNSVEKTSVVYNANCYLCNDPVTGDPVCKPVLKATTFCADEYLGLPKDYPVKYVDTLPVSPDIEDYIYSYDETESLVGKPLKVIRDKYFGAANTKCIVLNGKTVADIGANYTYWTDTDGTSYVSTQDSSYSDSCVVETAFKAGDATNQLLYDIGSGEGGEGSLELSNLPVSSTANLAFVDQYGKIAYCDTGVQACKDSSGDLVLKRENLTATFSPTGFTESSEDALNNCRQTIDEANGFRRAICCGSRCNIIVQDKYGFTTTNTTDSDMSWLNSNIDCPIYAVQNRNGIETSSFRTGISYNNTGTCTKDFEVKSYCSGLCNDLKFNTDLRYCRYGLSYTGRNNVNGSYNSLSIGDGTHSYSESYCAATNIGGDCCYTVNTYIDETWAYNNRLKTIKSKAAEENTYKQLKLQTHLNTSVHDSSIRYECIEMTYSCVCCGNTCFEGKTKYCTTNGKWYVCCDSTKGYKCLLNEDEMPTASVSVNANNDNSWYSLVGTTNNTDLIYSCANYVRVHPDAGRIQAIGGFTNDNSAILCVGFTNELNIIPGSGTDTWINYRGGSNNVYIGNGDGSNNGWGTLHAALVDSNLKGRIMMNDGYCATDCNFMPYSGTAGVYGMSEGDWSHFLTFSHGNFDTSYGTAVQVPFWDNQRFGWRVRSNGTLCGYHELLDDRGGQTIGGDMTYALGETAAGTNLAYVKGYNSTTGAGYRGGAYLGHLNASYDGYWGYATVGFYNDETGALTPNICMARGGYVFFNGGISAVNAHVDTCVYGPYGWLDFTTNNRVELVGANGSGGTVVYGQNKVGYAYVTDSGLYLNGGNGTIHNQMSAEFESNLCMIRPNVGTVLSVGTSNGDDDVDVYSRCNLGISTHNNGDLCISSDYDLCASARCRICFEAPIVLVCNTNGDLCWETNYACGVYLKNPSVYCVTDVTQCASDFLTSNKRPCVLNCTMVCYAQYIPQGSSNCMSPAPNFNAAMRWTGMLYPIDTSSAIFVGTITGVDGFSTDWSIHGGFTVNANNTVWGGILTQCR